ncbi:hypothetical protein KY285_008115 [Solanum tuberosum]|nr:hypothetical protein KY285_008115 [Solanum tuberosum]
MVEKVKQGSTMKMEDFLSWFLAAIDVQTANALSRGDAYASSFSIGFPPFSAYGEGDKGEAPGRVHFHRERFNPATGSPTATLLRLYPSRRPHRGMRQARKSTKLSC